MSASPPTAARERTSRHFAFGPQNRTCLKPRVASRFWQMPRPRTSHDHGWQPRSRERSLLPAVGVWSRPAGGRAMRGSLGEKINQGGTADIHAWAPGQVVKLFKEGFPPQLGQQEARMTRAVFAAGAPAPEVFGEVTLDGRFGIVLGRLDGPTLLQLTRSGAVTFAQAGAILASLGLSVHRMSPPPGAFYLRGWMDTAFRLSGDIVPKHIASGILALIDWTFTIRAPAALDRGFTHISLTEFALDVTDNPQRPLAVNAAAQSEYARLSGKPVAALRQAMETWLPIAIVRYFLLMGGPTSERWRRMMQSAEAALRPQD